MNGQGTPPDQTDRPQTLLPCPPAGRRGAANLRPTRPRRHFRSVHTNEQEGHPHAANTRPPGRSGIMPAEPERCPQRSRIARLAVAGQRYGHARALLAAHLPAADLHSVELRDLIDAETTYAAGSRTGHRPDPDTPRRCPLAWRPRSPKQSSQGQSRQ